MMKLEVDLERVTVEKQDLIAWRDEWLSEHDPKDGTDCVTPFDRYLYADADPQLSLATLGQETVAHLKEMYPAAFEAVTPTAQVSLRNFVQNRVRSAFEQSARLAAGTRPSRSDGSSI